LWGCLAIIVWAAWAGQQAIVVVPALLLVTGVLGRLWSRYALNRVSYERVVSEHRAFPGEEIDLTVRITNGKLLPVAWMRADDQVPARLAPDVSHWQPSDDGRGGTLVHLASLLWYRRISWNYKLCCRRRGLYVLGPVRLTSGDAFGFFARQLHVPATEQLIVYPRILPVEELEPLPHQPLGDLRAGQPIFEDPSRTVGIRDYRPADALKRIHWKASARRQRLQVRVYEPTTTPQSVLVLGLEGFGNDTVEEEEHFELAVSAIASLANRSIAQRQATGLIVNGGLPDGRDFVCLQPAAGHEDLMRILEVLAAVAPVPTRPLPELLLEENRQLPWGASLMLVVEAVDEVLLEALRQLQQQGRRVSFCALGAEFDPLVGLGVPVQRLALGITPEMRMNR
jgi:uncharacterized protein (DUF58 family)